MDPAPSHTFIPPLPIRATTLRWVESLGWGSPGQSRSLGYGPSECPQAPCPPRGSPCAPSSSWDKSLGTMLTDLESAINSLIEVFHKYSLEKGNYHAIYADDLKRLLETECPKYMKVRRGWV